MTGMMENDDDIAGCRTTRAPDVGSDKHFSVVSASILLLPIADKEPIMQFVEHKHACHDSGHHREEYH
jgi:hypothetical protein